jgi:hypothetical protein
LLVVCDFKEVARAKVFTAKHLTAKVGRINSLQANEAEETIQKEENLPNPLRIGE